MPRPSERVSRVGGRDLSRRENDYATLREVGAIVTEGNKRISAYIDESFEMHLQYLESRRLKNRIKARIHSVLQRFK